MYEHQRSWVAKLNGWLDVSVDGTSMGRTRVLVCPRRPRTFTGPVDCFCAKIARVAEPVLVQGTRADNRAEDVHLLKIDVHQVRQLALDVVDGFLDRRHRHPWR
jgi:hypothetical protein